MSQDTGFSTAFIGELAMCRDVGNFSFGWWRANPFGDDVAPHGHDDPHFMYIATGRYLSPEISADSEKLPAPLLFNPSQTFHHDHFEDGSGCFFAVTLAQAPLHQAGTKLPSCASRVETPRAYALVFELMRECTRWSTDSAMQAESLCLELAAAVSLSDYRERRPPNWLTTVTQRLSEGLNETLSMDDLARLAGVHPFHVTRIFRRFHRSTPGDFRRARRLERAATLLTTTRHHLAEIALDTGFADQSHLSNCFRRNYGLPPGQFRRLACASR